jgi:hypothetical protein
MACNAWWQASIAANTGSHSPSITVPLGRSCDCKSWEQLLDIIQKLHSFGSYAWMSILQI